MKYLSKVSSFRAVTRVCILQAIVCGARQFTETRMLYILVSILCVSCGNSEIPYESASTPIIRNGESTAEIFASGPAIGLKSSGYRAVQVPFPTIAAVQAQSNSMPAGAEPDSADLAQPISGAAAETELNSPGQTVFAPAPASEKTTIPTETVDTSDWPANANGELPLAGVFYGNPAAGEATTNATISIESSRRFRAQRSGGITSVRFHNRVLSQNDINKKCERSINPDSQWCQCKRADLDARSCGYSIGNSYSVGNGGLIVVEVRPDDGGGLPSEVVLGKTASYVPLEEYEKSGSHYITLDFKKVVDLQLGGLYHLVFTNLNPPDSCQLFGLSTSQAASCPRNKGAISLNGVLDRNIPTTTGRWGPMQGDKSAANLYRSRSDNSWQLYEKGIAFYEVYYTDGVAVGESYHALDAMHAGERQIGGSSIARQRFTVEDAGREVDGVWLNFGHSPGADGSALSVELKGSKGQILAKGPIAASKHCVRKNDRKCRDWGYTKFEDSVSLHEGDEYALEISASAHAKVRLSTYQPLRLYQKFNDRNDWANARAEISDNSGRSWGEWTSYKGDVRDLAVLFTLEGMPRKLP